MTRTGQVQRPTREGSEVGFLQQVPPSLPATLKQRPGADVRPAATEPPPDRKNPADPDSPEEAEIFGAFAAVLG